MSREGKALILTWVLIGLVIAGIIGFYLGRKTLPQNQGGPQQGIQQLGPQQPGPQGGQLQGSPPPTGGQQPPPRGQPQPPPDPNQ